MYLASIPEPAGTATEEEPADLASLPHMLFPDEATVVLDDDWWLDSAEVAAFTGEVARHLREHRRRPSPGQPGWLPRWPTHGGLSRRLSCSAAQIRSYQLRSRNGPAPISATSGSLREITSCPSCSLTWLPGSSLRCLQQRVSASPVRCTIAAVPSSPDRAQMMGRNRGLKA